MYDGRAVPTAPKRATRPKRRIRLDNDERRAQLLGLARKAFSDRSYDDVSIDDLAREAKISKGLLYHYFPTKRDLYVAGLREIAEDLVGKIAAIPREGAPIDRVRGGIDAYLTHISQHSRAYVSLMRGGIGSDPEVAEVVESVRKRMLELFLEHTPFAAMLAKNARFHVSVRGWIGFVEGATIDWCDAPKMTREELRELLTQILFAIVQVIGPQIAASVTK
jgi:AcrR family transcriptional regulator